MHMISKLEVILSNGWVSAGEHEVTTPDHDQTTHSYVPQSHLLLLIMNPEVVSEVLYECETAIQDCVERFSSNLEDCNTRNRTQAATLVPRPLASMRVVYRIFSQGKKLGTLTSSVEHARASVLSKNGKSLDVSLLW